MSALAQALAGYLTMRRALGCKPDKTERLLGHFITFVKDRGEDRLTTETALAWATQPAGAAAIWTSRRLAEVRLFARHLHVTDPATEVPPVDLLPGRTRRATPYLYAPREIADLMRATAILRGSHPQATCRTLIGLPAVTGMRIGEAIGLDTDDFAAVGGILTVRNGKFGKSRELPLHPTVVTALDTYLRRDDRPRQANLTVLLSNSTGKRLRYTIVQPTFSKLLRQCGIAPRSAACPPGSMMFGMVMPSTPSSTATGLASPGQARAAQTRWGAALRSCQPILAMSILPPLIGTCLPHPNCWGWPGAGSSVTLAVTHDRTCHDLAGLLHRPPGPSAPGQPE